MQRLSDLIFSPSKNAGIKKEYRTNAAVASILTAAVMISSRAVECTATPD
jgi:hypothetical protein